MPLASSGLPMTALPGVTSISSTPMPSSAWCSVASTSTMSGRIASSAIQRLVGLVDHNVRHLVALELRNDLRADAAVATDDEVVPQPVQVSLQLALPPISAECIVRQRFREDAEPVKHGADADNDQTRREQPAGGSLRMHLGVTDCADRDDDHVEGVEQAPAVDEHVARNAEQDHDAEQDCGEAEPRQWMPDARLGHGPRRRRLSMSATASQCAGSAHVRANASMVSSSRSG